MSINTLLENPASQSKPWCNLYVDTLTAYKGINSENLDVRNNLTLNGTDGQSGQIIRKTPDGMEWADLPAASIDPGAPGQFLKTDDETGEVAWENFNLTEVPKGDPGQVLVTNSTGDAVEWGSLPPNSIIPGAPDQILVSTEIGPMWSPFINVETISVRGGSDLNYYKVLPPITTVWEHNGTEVSPLEIKMSRIGSVVTVSLTGIDELVPGPDAILTCPTQLPSEIRSNLPIEQPIVAYDNTNTPGNLIVTVGSGNISIRGYSDLGDWSGNRFNKINLTWHMD